MMGLNHLYEILTLKRPVEGKSVHEVLLKVADGRILAPEKRSPERDVPKALSAVCMSAIEKRRHRRYQSVQRHWETTPGWIRLHIPYRTTASTKTGTVTMNITDPGQAKVRKIELLSDDE